MVGIISLFILSALAPMSLGYEVKTTNMSKIIPTTNNGTLSGFVNDSTMNPIRDARVRVSFHGTYEEDYTDSSGYYHVTNIPICWCMKNCTASKEGYSTEEVWLSINENTTYDFVLSCISLQADANGPYFSWDYEPIQFYGSAYCGSEPYSWHWDFGDNWTSEEQNPIHNYFDTGEYTVVLSVTDNENNTAIDVTKASMYYHPWSPIINGPNSGKTGVNYEYVFLATYPNDDDMSYYIIWDDGTITDWTSYLPCGEPYRENHIWDLERIYIIKAKAKTISGIESGWTTFEVKISNPRTRVCLKFFDMFPILQRMINFMK